jgi:hypothetical protein
MSPSWRSFLFRGPVDLPILISGDRGEQEKHQFVAVSLSFFERIRHIAAIFAYLAVIA